MDYSIQDFKNKFLPHDSGSSDHRDEYVKATVSHYEQLIPLIKEYTLMNGNKKTSQIDNIKRITYTFIDNDRLLAIETQIKQIYKDQRVIYTRYLQLVEFLRINTK